MQHIPDNIEVITIALPASVHGCIAEVKQGRYLILINANDSEARQQQALEHELRHYYDNDFQSALPVNAIEAAAHR
jgi:hypothetical protein